MECRLPHFQTPLLLMREPIGLATMQIANVVLRLRCIMRDFQRAQGGNVALIFAIAAIPIIAAICAAIDYSRANSVQTDLQNALDSVALMLSKEAASDTSSQLQANALVILPRFSIAPAPRSGRYRSIILWMAAHRSSSMARSWCRPISCKSSATIRSP
jgi:hypothetical protein